MAITPMSLVRLLERRLRKVHPRDEAVRAAKRRVRAQRDKRKEPADRKGYEYVVEALLRPLITRWGAPALRIPESDVACTIYSSHFHTTTDDEPIWRQRWNHFMRLHPSVRQSPRADLFLATGPDQLVSIEFKYAPSGEAPSIDACAAQLRDHLAKHDACMLVIYAARPCSPELVGTVRAIRHKVNGKPALVVSLVGPSITFP